MYLNHQHQHFNVGRELLCMLPLAGGSVPAALLQIDLGLPSQKALTALIMRAESENGVKIVGTNADPKDGEGRGRLLSLAPQSLATAELIAEAYWQKVYR